MAGAAIYLLSDDTELRPIFVGEGDTDAAKALGITPRTLAILVLVAVTGVHLLAPATGGRVQVAITALKVMLIVAFIGAGLASDASANISFAPTAATLPAIGSGAFASYLIFVSYAYSGFNAAAYFQGEVVDAERNVPRALVLGTLLVTVLYVALNYVFLKTTPIADLVGQVEVGAIPQAVEQAVVVGVVEAEVAELRAGGDG